jgi:hypothetical protein
MFDIDLWFEAFVVRGNGWLNESTTLFFRATYFAVQKEDYNSAA